MAITFPTSVWAAARMSSERNDVVTPSVARDFFPMESMFIFDGRQTNGHTHERRTRVVAKDSAGSQMRASKSSAEQGRESRETREIGY